MKLIGIDETFKLSATEDEVYLLIAGLRETLQEVPDWEFSTRVGVESSEVISLLDTIVKYMRRIVPIILTELSTNHYLSMKFEFQCP